MAEEGKKKIYIVVFVVVAILAMVIALIVTSLQKLNSDEVGIGYDTIQKRLFDDVKNEGLHTGPPGFEIIKFPSVFKSIDFGALTCLNKDGVDIVLDISYQYQARANNLKSIITQFKDHDGYLKVLRAAGESAIHESCSQFNTTQFQAERARFQEMLQEQLKFRYTVLLADITDLQFLATLGESALHESCSKYKTSQLQAQRAAFQEEVRLRLRERYDRLHSDVTDLQVNNIKRPSDYETAVRDKEAARENIKVAVNEQPRLLTKARTELREAETQAEITTQKAEADAVIIQNRAQTEAAAILNEYQKESETYLHVMNDLNLGTEGFLSYIGVRAISAAKNPVYVGMKGPAKTSYVTP